MAARLTTRLVIVDEGPPRPPLTATKRRDGRTSNGVPMLGVTATPERGTGGGLEGRVAGVGVSARHVVGDRQTDTSPTSVVCRSG